MTGYWEFPFSDRSPRLYPIARQVDYESGNNNCRIIIIR